MFLRRLSVQPAAVRAVRSISQQAVLTSTKCALERRRILRNVGAIRRRAPRCGASGRFFIASVYAVQIPVHYLSIEDRNGGGGGERLSGRGGLQRRYR